MSYIDRLRKRRQEKKQNAAAYDEGQQTGDRIIVVIDGYLTPRLSTLSKNVLDVFRDRLKNIYDQPQYDPRDVAKVELKICLDHLKEFAPKLFEETLTYLSLHDWLDIIGQLRATKMVDTYIKQKMMLRFKPSPQRPCRLQPTP